MSSSPTSPNNNKAAQQHHPNYVNLQPPILSPKSSQSSLYSASSDDKTPPALPPRSSSRGRSPVKLGTSTGSITSHSLQATTLNTSRYQRLGPTPFYGSGGLQESASTSDVINSSPSHRHNELGNNVSNSINLGEATQISNTLPRNFDSRYQDRYPEDKSNILTRPLKVETEYTSSGNRPVENNQRNSGNFSVKVTASGDRTKQELLNSLRARYEHFDSEQHRDKELFRDIYRNESYRDHLEGADFVNKVSKFEFLSHSSSSPSPKSPARSRFSPQRSFDSSPTGTSELSPRSRNFNTQRSFESSSNKSTDSPVSSTRFSSQRSYDSQIAEKTANRAHFSPQRSFDSSSSPVRTSDSSPGGGLSRFSPQRHIDSSPTGPGSVHIPSPGTSSNRVRPITLPKSFRQDSFDSNSSISSNNSNNQQYNNETSVNREHNINESVDHANRENNSNHVFRYDEGALDGKSSSSPLYAKTQNRSCEFSTHAKLPLVNPLYIKQTNQSFDYKPGYSVGNKIQNHPFQTDRDKFTQELHEQLASLDELQKTSTEETFLDTSKTRPPRLHYLKSKSLSEEQPTAQTVESEIVSNKTNNISPRSSVELRNRSASPTLSNRSKESPKSLVNAPSPRNSNEIRQRNISPSLSPRSSSEGRAFNQNIQLSPEIQSKLKELNEAKKEYKELKKSRSDKKLHSRSPSPKRVDNTNPSNKPPPSPAEAKDNITKRLYSPKEIKAYSSTDVPSKFAFGKEASKPPPGIKTIKSPKTVPVKIPTSAEETRKFVYKSASLDRVTASAIQKSNKNQFDYESSSLRTPLSPPLSPQPFHRSRADSFDNANISVDAKSAKLVSRSPKVSNSQSPPVFESSKSPGLLDDDEPIWLVRPDPSNSQHHSLYPVYKEYLKDKEKITGSKKEDKPRERSNNKVGNKNNKTVKTKDKESVTSKEKKEKSVTTSVIDDKQDNNTSHSNTKVVNDNVCDLETIKSDVVSQSPTSPLTPGGNNKSKNKFWSKLTKSASKDSVSGQKDKKSKVNNINSCEKESKQKGKKKKDNNNKEGEETIESPLAEKDIDYIDDDDFAFSSRINSTKHTKVYFAGLDQFENKENSSEKAFESCVVDFNNKESNEEVEIVHLGVAHLSDASLDSSKDGKLNLDSSLTDSKASSESINSSKASDRNSLKSKEDKDSDIDSYAGEKCFFKDTVVTNIVLPGYKKSDSIDTIDKHLSTDDESAISLPPTTVTVSVIEEQSKLVDSTDVKSDNSDCKDIEETNNNNKTEGQEDSVNNINIFDKKEQGTNYTEAYINQTPSYHDYDDVPIYDEVPMNDSPPLKHKQSHYDDSKEDYEDISKLQEYLLESRKHQEEESSENYQKENTTSDNKDSSEEKNPENSDSANISNNKPAKKTVTFAVVEKEELYQEVASLRHQYKPVLIQENPEIVTEEYRPIVEEQRSNVIQGNLKAGADSVTENNNSSSSATKGVEEMDRFGNEPHSPLRGAVKVMPTDTTFGVNMLRQTSASGGGGSTGLSGDIYKDISDSFKAKMNGDMFAPSSFAHQEDDTVSTSTMNTDSTSFESLDMEDLTGSQQDLKELHKRMKDERKREQEIAEQEKHRSEFCYKLLMFFCDYSV